MSRSVIVSAVRTPFGKLNGGLASHSATDLGAIAVRAGLERVELEGREVDYVIMGQVLQAGVGQAPARQASVGAGIPIEVPSDTVNKVCASSIRGAIEIADSMIRAGDVELVVTGGMESMTNAPYALPKARAGYRMGDGTLRDLMIWDGLRSTFDDLHMVQQAAKVARELGISREDQDAWALRSHERAAAAQDAGRFDDELVPGRWRDGRRVGASRLLASRSSPRSGRRCVIRRARSPLATRPESTTELSWRRRLLGDHLRAAAWARAARDDRIAGLRRR